MLSRILITKPSPIRDARGDVPLSVQRVLEGALARSPDDRFTSGTGLATALRAAEVTTSQSSAGGWRDRRLRIALSGLAAIAVLATGGLLRERMKSMPVARASLPEHAAKNPQVKLSNDSLARQLYLRGRAQVARRTNAGVVDAMNLFSRAIQRDSNFAVAWAGLSGTAEFAVSRGLPIPGKGADSLLSIAVSASERAVELDSTDADIWLVRARAALAVDPTDRTAYARGVPWADSAIALDPTYVLAREAAGQLALELGHIDDAERHFRAYLNLTAGREQVNGYAFLVRVALARGDSTTARKYAAKAASLADSRNPTKHEAALLGMAMAAIGDTVRAVRWIAAFQPRGDLHFQLHLKRDPQLRWLRVSRGKGLVLPDPWSGPTP